MPIGTGTMASPPGTTTTTTTTITTPTTTTSPPTLTTSTTSTAQDISNNSNTAITTVRISSVVEDRPLQSSPPADAPAATNIRPSSQAPRRSTTTNVGGRRMTLEQEQADIAERKAEEHFSNYSLPLFFGILNALLITILVIILSLSVNSSIIGGNPSGSTPEDAITRIFQFLIVDGVVRLVMTGHCIHTVITYLCSKSEKVAAFWARVKQRTVFGSGGRGEHRHRMRHANSTDSTILVIMDSDARSHITNVILSRVYAAWCIGGHFLFFFSLAGRSVNTSLFAFAATSIGIWEITAIVVVSRSLYWFIRRALEEHRRMSAIRALRNRFSNNNRRNSSSEPRIIELGAARSMFRNPPTASETSAAAATKLSAFSNGSDWKKNVGGSNGTLSIPDGMSVDHLEPTVLVNFAGLTTYSFKKVEISDATEKEMEHVVVKDEMDGDTKPADVTLTIEITTQDLLSKDTSEALNHSCPICMCDFENGDMVRRLKCGHEYHMSCVDPWVLSRPPIAPSFPISSSSSSTSSTSSSLSTSALLNSLSTNPTTHGIRRCPLCGRDPITAQSPVMTQPPSLRPVVVVQPAVVVPVRGERPRTDRLARRDGGRRQREEAMAVAAAAALAAQPGRDREEVEFVSASEI